MFLFLSYYEGYVDHFYPQSHPTILENCYYYLYPSLSTPTTNFIHWLFNRKGLAVNFYPIYNLYFNSNSKNDTMQAALCGYAVLIMAVYWMTESLPLPVTSLIPVVLFPLLGIMDTGAVCTAYMKVRLFFIITLTQCIIITILK